MKKENRALTIKIEKTIWKVHEFSSKFVKNHFHVTSYDKVFWTLLALSAILKIFSSIRYKRTRKFSQNHQFSTSFRSVNKKPLQKHFQHASSEDRQVDRSRQEDFHREPGWSNSRSQDGSFQPGHQHLFMNEQASTARKSFKVDRSSNINAYATKYTVGTYIELKMDD